MSGCVWCGGNGLIKYEGNGGHAEWCPFVNPKMKAALTGRSNAVPIDVDDIARRREAGEAWDTIGADYGLRGHCSLRRRVMQEEDRTSKCDEDRAQLDQWLAERGAC